MSEQSVKYELWRENIKLVDCVNVADTFVSRMKGLLGRDNLPEEEGLLIKPCNSIHMFFMRFSISAVFVTRDYKVLKVYEKLKPWQIGGCIKAAAVFELNEKIVDRFNLKTGDQLRLIEVISA